MISKRCDRCGKRIAVGQDCGCRLTKQKRMNNELAEKDKSFYNTNEWNTARLECIKRCHGIDLYSLFVLNKIEYGFTVHHIVPLDDDYSLRKTQSNLIYLTESNHQTVHRLYDGRYFETIDLLRSLLQRFAEAGGV